MATQLVGSTLTIELTNKEVDELKKYSKDQAESATDGQKMANYLLAKHNSGWRSS